MTRILHAALLTSHSLITPRVGDGNRGGNVLTTVGKEHEGGGQARDMSSGTVKGTAGPEELADTNFTEPLESSNLRTQTVATTKPNRELP